MDIEKLELHELTILYSLFKDQGEMMSYVKDHPLMTVKKTIADNCVCKDFIYPEEKKVIKGDKRSEYYKKVFKHLDKVMPRKKGFHRDHIVPVSFCYKLGVSYDLVNIDTNLRYVTEEENMSKHGIIEDCEQLFTICALSGVGYPSIDMITKHNKRCENLIRARK